MEEKTKYLEVSVRGLKPDLWKKKRGLFIEKISEAVEVLMNKIIDPISETTLREESREIISLGLNHIKSKLAKPGLENEKIIAEVQELYSRIEQISIVNRKIIAETENQEFKNFLNKLEFSLGATKLLLKKDIDDDALIFLKQIDEWIELVKTVKNGFV